MNWRFWKKIFKSKEKIYDEELEKYLEQSQLHPYLQAGLDIIDRAISGEIQFFKDSQIEEETQNCDISFWYLTDTHICLRIYTKNRANLLEIKCTQYHDGDRKYEFILKLPVDNGKLEIINIEKTRLYEEFHGKLFSLFSPERKEGASEIRTKALLKKDAQKHRLHNLFK